MTAQLLSIEYGLTPSEGGDATVPVYAGAVSEAASTGELVVNVTLSGCGGVGGGSACEIRAVQPCPLPDAAQCGDAFSLLVAPPASSSSSASSPPPAWLPATPTLGPDGATLSLAVAAPAGSTALASAYGRGNFPLLSLYQASGGERPVIPWCFLLGPAAGAVPCYAANLTHATAAH